MAHTVAGAGGGYAGGGAIVRTGVRAGLAAFLAVLWLLATERLAAPLFGETRPVLTAIEAATLAGLALAAVVSRARPVGSWWTVTVGMCLGPPLFSAAGTALPADILAAPVLGALCAFALCLGMAGAVSYALGRVALGDLSSTSGVVGAVAGAFMALAMGPFVLFPRLGTRASLAAAAALAALAATRHGLRALTAVRALAVAAAGGAALALAAGALPHPGVQAESPEGVVRVWQAGSATVLSTGSGAAEQSLVRARQARTHTYTDTLALAAYLPPARASACERPVPVRVLVLGLGGASVVHTWRSVGLSPRRLDVVGVEADPAVVEAGRRYFGLDRLHIRLRVGDGRAVLRADRERYDAILVDAYSHEAYLPFAMAGVPFARLVRAHLAPGGSVWLNLNATGRRDPLLRSVEATYGRVFAALAVTPAKGSGRFNRILVAGGPDLGARLRRLGRDSGAAVGVPAALGPVAAALRWTVVRADDLARAPVWTDDRADPEGAVDAAIWRGLAGRRPAAAPQALLMRSQHNSRQSLRRR